MIMETDIEQDLSKVYMPIQIVGTFKIRGAI